jgi:hypothetical protein
VEPVPDVHWMVCVFVKEYLVCFWIHRRNMQVVGIDRGRFGDKGLLDMGES